MNIENILPLEFDSLAQISNLLWSQRPFRRCHELERIIITLFSNLIVLARTPAALSVSFSHAGALTNAL
jgi:hypothetical protein